MQITTNPQTMKQSTRSFPLFIICVILIFGIQSYTAAQSKKEVQFSLDTLIKSNQSLQEDYKTMKEAWKKQNSFFEHVKSTLFDASEINTAIEDGISKFDEINKLSKGELDKLNSESKLIKDSLIKITDRANVLESQNKAYNQILLSALSAASFPKSAKDFVGTWDLFLNPVQLSGEPFESGIIGFNTFTANDSLNLHNVYKIEFTEDELATIYFNGGEIQKSFYSVKDFSDNEPYIIKFSKNDDFKLTMLVSPVASGLMVSYELPLKSDKVYYYYGLMKK